MTKRSITIGLGIVVALLVMAATYAWLVNEALLRNVPIVYYGKVVDQDERPVSGVRVRGGVMVSEGFGMAPVGRHYNFTVTTDDSGSFTIQRKKGYGLDIDSLKKDGYLYCDSPRRERNWVVQYTGNGSADYKPRRDHPEVFYLILREAMDPLIHYSDRVVSVSCDGTPVRIDLTTGKLSPGGNLRITLKREPYDIAPGGPHYYWVANIDVVGGGMVELKGIGTYRAPDQGYEPMYKFEQSADDPKWSSQLHKTFYIRTQDDRYGRMELTLDTDNQPPPAKARIEVYFNPRPGARMLEYNSSK